MIEVLRSKAPLEYLSTIKRMEMYVDQMIHQKAAEAIWLLEHQDVLTAGASAKEADLLDKNSFPVIRTGRGGQYTYHGPGQRIIYVMLRLADNEKDLKKYVFNLEQVIINVLQKIGLNGTRKENKVGIWIDDSVLGVESKIAAIGIRVRKWVTYHGIAINIKPNLEGFRCIVPCGIKGYGVTSLETEGFLPSLEEFDALFIQEFTKVFCTRCSEDIRIL